MKPPLRFLLIGVVMLVAGLGAQAQGDEVLERYDLALTNLSESLALITSDPASSRDELDRASAALRFMASEAGTPGLIEAMERVFERARTAISNRSFTDLAVQAAVLRGGFRRALFESGLARLEADRALALGRIDHLAANLQLPQDARSQLQESADAAQARRHFTAAVSARISGALDTAQELAPQNKDDAYIAIAQAYGDFLLIQDSPLAEANLNDRFGEAIDNLLADQTEEVAQALAVLSTSFAELSAAARNQAAQEAQQEPPVAVAGLDQTVEGEAGNGGDAAPDEDSQGLEAAESSDGEEAASEETSQLFAPIDVEGTGQSQDEEQVTTPVTEEDGDSDARALPPAPSQVDSDDEDAASLAGGETGTRELLPNEETSSAAEPSVARALQAELIAAGVQAERAVSLASSLQEAGVNDLESALDNLYAAAGRVLSGLQLGDEQAAATALARFEASYRRELQPVVVLLDAKSDRRILRLAGQLEQAPGARPQDASVLLGQVGAIASLLAGESVGSGQLGQAETQLYWAGWPRALILMILALLAILPLYLLNLAFGGGNRNWRLVGVALFLLLLPIMYEGLVSLAAVVGDLAGLPQLAYAASFSIFAGPVGQAAWAVITAIAIILAGSGLYGVCVQFGLLGARRISPGDSQTLISHTAVPDANTVVDWDEEF